MRIWAFLESIAQDTKYGARSLRRQPGVFLTAALTLGFAIGVNSSVFTVFNAVALRPWPVPDADRVTCLLSAGQGEAPAPKFSLAAHQYFSERSTSFSGLIATRQFELRIGQDESVRRAYGLLVTPNYFQVLKIGFQLGRPFTEEEGRQAVAVLGHSFWQTHLAEDVGIIGRQIRFDGVPFTVLGVAPPEFGGTFASEQDFWIPEGAESFLLPHGSPSLELTRSVNFESWAIAGRLAEGADMKRAQSEIGLLNRQFRADQRVQPTEVVAVGTALLANPSARAEIVPMFALIFAGVLLILLLASANVGNLILARAASRQREIAARLALGAGRMRLVRQLVTESALLALVAGSLGILLASWLPRVLLLAYLGERAEWLKPDFLVLVYTLVASLGACLVFGLAPALHATRLSLADAVKSQYSRFLGRYSLRSFLLAAQVAISVVLLICAGLLVRGVHAVSAQDPGFVQTGVSWTQVRLPANLYDTPRSQALMEQLQADAVESGLWSEVALTTHVPLGPGRSGLGVKSGPGSTGVRMAVSEEVSPEYFGLLKIPVLYGRVFGPGDRGRNLAMINEAMAKRLAPGQPAIGQIIRSGRSSYEVIGVVRDAHTADLYSVDPTLYRLVSNGSAQDSPFRPVPSLLLKSNGGGLPGDKALQAMALRLEPRAIVQVRPLSGNIDSELKPARVGATLAGILGLVALFLAGVGLLGVFAYSVRRQSPEIATRMALGARPAQVVGQVLLSSSRPAGLGLVVGLLSSLAASRLLEVHLYGVSSVEPMTYLLVGLLVVASALAASIWPAWMITRIEPAGALRAD